MKLRKVTVFIFVILMITTVSFCSTRASKSSLKSRAPALPEPLTPDTLLVLVPLPVTFANNSGVPSGAQRSLPGRNEISSAPLNGKQEFIVTRDGIGLLIPHRPSVSRPARPSFQSGASPSVSRPGSNAILPVSIGGNQGFIRTRNLLPNLEPGTFVTTSGFVRSPSSSGPVDNSLAGAIPGGNGIPIESSVNPNHRFIVTPEGLRIITAGTFAQNSRPQRPIPQQNRGRAPAEFSSQRPSGIRIGSIDGINELVLTPGGIQILRSAAASPPRSFNSAGRAEPQPENEFENFASTNENAPVQKATEVFTYLFNNDDVAPKLVFSDKRFL
ncbi:unnamed protein product [Orchesella dallaii]|uniref:Uncharacterized protein n=1 Tax=Orchesella dallaii TaxID=48710 RepID=A0ABP1QFY9_9HEXA